MNTLEKLAALRGKFAGLGIGGFILPVADEHLGEYVPDSARRLEWLTGFSGSAGLAAVLPDKAALFTDGRYTLQARMEAPELEIFNTADAKPEDRLPKDVTLGYDPWLHSISEIERLSRKLTLRPVSPNPVDALWKNRPAPPLEPAFIHELSYAGEEHAEKRRRVAEAIKKSGADCAVLAASDSVNWLFNVRGRDLEFSPLVLAYAVLDADGSARLYADERKFDAKLRTHLGREVELRPLASLAEDMRALQGKVLRDASLTPAWFAEAIAAEQVRAEDPCQGLKAVKNPVELQGMRSAHMRDGLAVTRFLCWLDGQKRVTELQAMAKLLEFRSRADEFFSPSFETIAGSGAHGAIVHYRATEKTDRALEQGELFLLDSGGQYFDGTTDITRTIAIGKPGEEQRKRFTQVLKGHIALAAARFPEGTSGASLDVLARQFLWQAGCDYDHGTGHGVGHFLNVHEGPQRIGKRGGDVGLKPGMIVSDEPGYYKEGAFGIRIESLVAVREEGRMENGKALLGFETLTLAPIDARLICKEMLSEKEKEWLNAYHARVRDIHSPHFNREENAWLEKACAVI